MMKRIASLALILSIAAPALASASSIDDRQASQADRIERGRDNGSITWTEGIKLARRAEPHRSHRGRALEADGSLLEERSRHADRHAETRLAESFALRATTAGIGLFGLPRVGK